VTEVYVALGSNLGDRLANLAAAVGELAATRGVHVLDVSHVVESEPWGIEDQPSFANAVVRLDVRMPADALLARLKEIESLLQREPGPRNGPRTIDLDVLLYGDEEWESPELTIPHPRMLERDFVVTPLLEIAPKATLPDGTSIGRERAVLGRVVRGLGAVPGFERGR